MAKFTIPKSKAPVSRKTPTMVDDIAEQATRLSEVFSKGREDFNERMAKAMVAVAKINAKYKTSKVTPASQMALVDRVETGYLSFDVVTGGGFPRQRASQVKGQQHSGKTTILLDTVARLQRAGGIATWINGEEFDREWARLRGVDLDQLILIPFSDGTTMLEQAISMFPVSDLVALDSVQTIKTLRALDTDIGETGYGSGSPQMWGDFNGKVNYQFARGGSNAALVWVSQMRAKIQTGWVAPNADKDDGTQINTLLHWKALDVRFRPGGMLRVEEDKKDHDPYGRKISLKCEKNKVGPRPFREADYHYIFGEGGPPGVELNSVDKGHELVSLGRHFGIFTNSGAHYYYKNERLAQGLEKLHDFFRQEDNRDLYDQVAADILNIARSSLR